MSSSTHKTPKRKRPTKRKSAREMKQQLRSIYAGKNGALPDLSKLQSRSGSAVTSFLLKLIGGLFVLSLVAWGGFFLFTQGIFQEQETLSVTVEGPDTIKSGEEVEFIIRYENTGDVPIAALTMKLNLPETFHMYDTLTQPDGEQEWIIGSLNPKSDGAITLSGVFLADVPSTQRIQSLFTYKPANFSSEFQDITTHKVTIEDSVIALSFSGPEKALAGDTSELIINVQNTSKEPIYNLRVLPSLTENFTVQTAEPEQDDGQTYWTIDQLLEGELVAITIQGSFTSSASGEQTLAASVGFVSEDLYYTQSTQEFTTDVLGGSVSYSVIVNGSTESQTAKTGDNLRVSIDFENGSGDTMKDLGFDLALSTENGDVPIDFDIANISGAEQSGNTLTWSGATTDNLAELPPEGKGVIDLTLPIKDILSESDADQFDLTVTLTLAQISGVSGTRTIESTPIRISINSDVQASSHARYFAESGAEIGSGPWPPEVGETSTLRVYWNVSNSLHALKDVQLSTTLPQDVTWTDISDTTIGTVSYSATTRQVTWSVPKLITDIQSAGAWFEVAINPSTQDAGRFMKLTNTTSVKATDVVTGESITDTLDILTTELPHDNFAAGQGVVVE